MPGLYIHIPFCANKCTYCNFCTTKNINDRENFYIDSIIKEMTLYKGEKIDTIYLGGGTPSILTKKSLYKIKENLDKNFRLNIKEFSIENNPEDINDEYLNTIKNIGVNRLSIGCQTFDNKILEILNRKHREKDTIKAIELSKKYFDNISIDLMLGLPLQNERKIIKDIEIFNKLDLNHISIYGLKLEENTKLNYLKQNNIIKIPNEDFQADMYFLLSEILKSRNVFRYEISNFSKKGFNSIHNLKYWKREDYIGIGVSAHSLLNNKRYSNISNIQKYINNANNFIFEYENEENIDINEQEREKIILAFRLNEGLDLREFMSLFNYDFLKKYDKIIEKYNKCFEINKNKISIKDKYIYSLNTILAEF